MKYVLTVVFCFVLLSGVCTAADKPAFESQKDKESYSIGYQIGADFKKQGVDLNMDVLLQGMKDITAGSAPKMTPDEMGETILNLRKRVMAAQQEEMRKQAEKTLAEGKAFLADNAKKEGVKTTASGLQYKVVKEGDGHLPKETDTVSVHYRGTLIDGTEFDSSYKRNEPETLPVGGLIKGWTEALQLMKVGSKWQLFLPSDLAYGERGAGQVIPPNSVLVFDIELLKIVKEEAAKEAEKKETEKK